MFAQTRIPPTTPPSTPPSTPEPEVAQAYIELTDSTPDAHSWKTLYLMPKIGLPSLSTQSRSFHAFSTTPAEEHLSAYGVQDMAKRARTMSIYEEIVSSVCQAHEKYRHDPVRLHSLATPCQVAILSRDILNSDPGILARFTQYLVFIGLNLLGDYNSPAALELLAKDQASLLRVFRACQRHQCEALLRPPTSAEIPSSTELHKISLVRSLFELSNCTIDARPHELHPEHTVDDNLDFYGSLVEVTGANCFGNFDPAQMHDALLKSSVFKNDPHTPLLDIVAWSRQIMEHIPIGFPEGYLDLPSQVLRRLSTGDVESIRVHIERTYEQYPCLQRSQNNILLLLTWSSMIRRRPLSVINGWANSDDAFKLSQRLIRDFQQPQSAEQLALTLNALLHYNRLLPHKLTDSNKSINGCYLADLDAILHGKVLSNQRAVFERIEVSFLRAFKGYSNVVGLLAITLHSKPPLLLQHNGCVDQYAAGRMNARLSHASAFKGFEDSHGMEPSSPRADDISEDWCMIDSPI